VIIVGCGVIIGVTIGVIGVGGIGCLVTGTEVGNHVGTVSVGGI
jgi:hypothetical protein